MHRVLNELYFFFLKPSSAKFPSLSVKITFKDNLLLLLIAIIFALITSIISVVLKEIFIINSNYESYSLTFKTSSTFLIVSIKLIIIPVIEEFSTRLYLKFKPINIAVSFALLMACGFCVIFKVNILKLDYLSFIIFVITIFLAYTIHYILSISIIRQKFEHVFVNNFKYIFYSSIVIFSIFHFNKYIIEPDKLYIYPILILPQIITGIIWGYVRIKFGIMWSIIQHICFNMIFNLPLLFLIRAH